MNNFIFSTDMMLKHDFLIYLFLKSIGRSALVGQPLLKLLVRLSVRPSIRPSLSFLKIGSLVFSAIVHDDS